ncbi:MAG: phosphoadenosine phosphosulfate reductase [Granulosicoccus sp.]|nr:phosphoadenosine phosphosulfate reductase [Granulosicoccus sp.]
MPMREILELQTGQVAFISGLMSGFSLSIAAHVLRYGIRSGTAQLVFILFLLSSLLFLVALYVDVRLSIELAGFDTLPQSLLDKVVLVRTIGTSCATSALFLFVVATGLLGWLATPATGIVSSLIAAASLTTLWFIWQNINALSEALGKLP